MVKHISHPYSRAEPSASENPSATFFRDEPPLGRDRMLRRGEFGAAVFEKRRSIRSRRAEQARAEQANAEQAIEEESKR